jgi:CBS domain-containing protein
MNDNVRDVMCPSPVTLPASASLLEAARTMREQDIGDVIVLEGNRLAGILTDRDLVVRGIAEGRDPERTRIGDVCSRELTTIAPDESVSQAVRIIREKAIRRLPVEEDGRVIGIVTMGDIALARDRRSALADVSAAPPNL